MYFIGLDLGTSALKLLLMEEGGQILNIVTKEYPLEFPQPGWSQQNPDDWLRAVLSGVAELLRGFDATQVAGIAAGGQMHGLVVLDEHDKVIRPAILWNDGRTQKQVEYLNGTIGKETLSERTANIAFAGFTAPKLLWMRENEPELFARIRKIMLPKDYINYRLTGVHCTDYSDASGMLLLDVKNKRWSAEMLELCGMREDQMPALYESWQPVGTLLPGMAAALGLSSHVKVCAGAGDNAAAAVGCGVVGDGGCNISLGTSGTVFITSKEFRVDSRNALHSFDHADGGYHLMGCILSAASCNKWWMEEILKTTDFATEQAPITPRPAGQKRCVFSPLFNGGAQPPQRPRRPRRVCRPADGFHPRRHDTGGAGGRGLCHPGLCGNCPGAGHCHRAQPGLRRRSQKPAVAADSCQCAGHSAGAAPDRAGTRLRRCNAGGGGLRRVPGRGGLRQSADQRQNRHRAGPGADRRL